MIAMPPGASSSRTVAKQASSSLSWRCSTTSSRRATSNLLRLRGDVVHRPCAQKTRGDSANVSAIRAAAARSDSTAAAGITCREQVFDEKTGTGAVVDNAARPVEIAPKSAEHDGAEPEAEVFFWKLRLPLPKARDHRRRPGHFVDDPLRFRTTLPASLAWPTSY